MISTSWGQVKILAINVSAQTVTVMHGDQTVVLRAGQVVLSAGALVSPQLLLRAGIGPAEQLGTDDLLQLAHPVAHCAGRDTQLFRSLRHAAQPGQGLKGQQALNGRYAGGGHALTIIRGLRCPYRNFPLRTCHV